MIENMQAPFRVERIGVIMAGDSSDDREAWGVLNPACARSRAGELFLFPRVVAENNFSRVGIARVVFDGRGDPVGVERAGYALEPTESYEQNARTAGCEDPRVTFLPELDTYIMTYTAYGPLGPRIAIAVSDDLFEWRRLGLVKFALGRGTEFDFYDNKDAVIFPRLLPDPHGRPSVVLIHRPDYNLAWPGGARYRVLPRGVTEERPSMWLSYCPVDYLRGDLDGLTTFRDHRLLATPEAPWEALKVGGGTPPVYTPHGWLTLFHGVSGRILEGVSLQPNVNYAAGALVLDHDDPTRVLYRSPQPILEPRTEDEKQGLVNNVVFPTALDVRENGRVDVYYGMADSRIGVGKLTVPAVLPCGGETELVA